MEEIGGYGQLQSCLAAGEYIVWKGQPVEGHIFSRSDLYLIPFSIMWGGFAIFWELSAIAMGAPLLFKIWGIPFVLVGLYMIAGRFFVQQSVRRNTYYAVTNRRVLQCRRGRIGSLERSGASEMHLFANKDGSGTIVFGDVRRNGSGYLWSYPGMTRQNGSGFSLENVPDVNQVYRILLQRQGETYETV